MAGFPKAGARPPAYPALIAPRSQNTKAKGPEQSSQPFAILASPAFYSRLGVHRTPAEYVGW